MIEVVKKTNLLLKRLEDQELRIYFFIGQKNIFDGSPLGPPQVDKIIVYLCEFKLEDAFEKAKLKIGNGYNLTFTGQKPTVREFLHELELESIALQVLSEPKPPEEKKEEPIRQLNLTPQQMNFEQFRIGLLFFANERGVIYQNPEDQEILQKIISGLKYEPARKQ